MTPTTKPRPWSWLLLLSTSATLICCALPILLVSIGLGTVVAAAASSAPWLITLSMHKEWIFVVSGGLIALATWVVYRPGRACPADPLLAAACERADSWNRRFIWGSAALWTCGFFAAFVLPLLVF